MLEKIKRSSVPQQAFDLLRQEILNGTYPVGSKLPSENELCHILGVSRPSVKTALQQLCFMGMAETRPGDGTYVKKFNIGQYIQQVTDIILDEENQDEMAEFRAKMELTYATVAMEHANERDFAKMDEILDKMDLTYKDNNFLEHSKLDFQLHYTICKSTHNQFFLLVFRMLSDTVYKYVLERNELFFLKPEENFFKYDVHRDIVTAIKNKDSETCRKIYEQKYKYRKQ